MFRYSIHMPASGADAPTLAELLSPYVDKSVAPNSPTLIAEGKTNSGATGELHLLQAEPWNIDAALRRWSEGFGESRKSQSKKFEVQYPELKPAFEHLQTHYEVDNEKLNALNAVVCAGRIEPALWVQALLRDFEGTCAFLFRIALNERSGAFFDGLTKLTSVGVSQERLKRYFALFPEALYRVAMNVSEHFSELEPHFTSSGEFDLAGFLADRQKTLTITIWEVASLHAARGLLQQLALPRNRIKLELTDGMTKELAEKHFPELTIKSQFHPENDPAEIFVRFKDSPTIDNHGNALLSVSYQPFKFAVPARAASTQRQEIRERMGLSPDRKVIVVSSPAAAEIRSLIPIVSELKKQAGSAQTRPLLILGIRSPGSSWAGFINRTTDLIACDRTIRDQRDGSEKWLVSGQGPDDLDVVVLQTQGELMDLFCVADLAVVGTNRNLMEPAQQGVPILYVPGNWDCNLMAKERLDGSGAAEEIDYARFAEQVRLRLEHPERYRDRADTAITRLNDELMPDAAQLVALSLWAMVVNGK